MGRLRASMVYLRFSGLTGGHCGEGGVRSSLGLGSSGYGRLFVFVTGRCKVAMGELESLCGVDVG